MNSLAETVRQLAPHWGVMFVAMLAVLAVAERVVDGVPLWASLLLVLLVAVGYPSFVRAVGVAPDVWKR
ncbi:hypothetical protein SAMN04488066_1289 [Halorubrum aquaticum]|uniref:Uncharacterized protein n=1 Tax=Halorubrum aquaticum TaxID=387340 RepID=A0A1I3CSG5_9EURY|nr:hypothetical protein [Halorubrum aquaticum]SFH77191.1 hypothetical protein SAMN04488066_1289 [Halorubrum aquaticum]